MRFFSPIACRLWGHLDPDPDEISIVMLGVTIATFCSACGGLTYERSWDEPLDNDPNFTLECC